MVAWHDMAAECVPANRIDEDDVGVPVCLKDWFVMVRSLTQFGHPLARSRLLYAETRGTAPLEREATGRVVLRPLRHGKRRWRRHGEIWVWSAVRPPLLSRASSF